jgi:hypothetical protein
MRCPGPLALLTGGWGTIRRRAKYKLNQHLRLVYLIEIKSAAIPNFKYSSRDPGRKPRSTCFGFRGCRLSDQKSKITQQQKVWVLRLKSEISFLPTRAAKTRTGVAVHENLLDSVMAAPLKRE